MPERVFRHIRQAISTDSLFNVLRQWCTDGAGQNAWELRLLSAFVSGSAVQALEPLIDVFLADGNKLEIIFGIDRNGTDRAAVRRLYALSTAYPGQVVVRLFHAPCRRSIFHAKLYMVLREDGFAGVIGSSNLTLSGLGSNLESLILCENIPVTDAIASEMIAIWRSFAEPAPPLRSSFLRDLTPSLRARLVNRLPQRSKEDRSGSREDLWQPLSEIKLPRTRQSFGRSSLPQDVERYMIYDIMHETRSTQMQIPLAVVEEFFGVQRDAPAEIEVSIMTGSSLSQPIVRPVVISKGESGRRLMRRLEMPTIRHLDRPLTAVFVKLERPHAFAYALCVRGTRQHRMTDLLLATHGQQGGGERRYYIGKPDDSLWPQVRELLKAT